MNAGDLCKRNVVTASQETGIPEAAQLMRDRHVGSLVVTETRNNHVEPVGILTDRDTVVRRFLF